MKKKKVILAALIALLSVNSEVFAKSISLNELQNSQANYVPAVNVTSKEIDGSHWVYKSLENITKKYGLLVGDAGDKFDGSKSLTRSEAAVILVNLIGKVEQEKIDLDSSEKTQIDILKNELSQEITALTGRVATLESNVNKIQGSVTKLQDSDKNSLKYGFGEDFKVTGALQLRYNGIMEKGVDSATFPPNFSIPYSDLVFSGKIAPHLTYTTQLQPSTTWATTVASLSSSNAIGGILGDAYVSTDIIPHHTVIFGQNRVPIGVEGILSTRAVDTVDRSQIARNFSNARDLGIKIAGSYPLFDYTVGAYNGAGQNYKDVSNDMGVGGWITAKPLYKLPQYGKLEMGGGYYRDLNGNTTNTLLASRFETQTWGASLYYKYKKIGWKNEWAMRRGYSYTTTPALVNPQDNIAKGMFSEATYDLNPKLQLLAKYDIFDQNQLVKNANNTEYTLGTNYFIGQNIKLQVDGVAVSNQAGKDSKRLMVLTQYVF